MDWNRPDQVDAELESMLRSEPMRPVPAGFAPRVKTRVALTAMLDWERQRWRYLKIAACVAAAAVLCCVVPAAVYPRLLEWAVGYFMPGGAGYLDYLVSAVWYGGYATTALLSAATLAAGAFLGYALQRKSSASRS